MRWSGCAARHPAGSEDCGPAFPVLRAQNAELGHDVAGELHIRQATRRDHMPVPNGGRIHIVALLLIIRYLGLEVLQAVAGVATATQESQSGERGGGGAD